MGVMNIDNSELLIAMQILIIEVRLTMDFAWLPEITIWQMKHEADYLSKGSADFFCYSMCYLLTTRQPFLPCVKL